MAALMGVTGDGRGAGHMCARRIPANRKARLGVSGDDTDSPERHDLSSPSRANNESGEHHEDDGKVLAPWLAAAGIGAAIVLAPIASANTDPLVPFGTDPHTPYVTGYHVSNHDEANTTNGQLDTPF